MDNDHPAYIASVEAFKPDPRVQADGIVLAVLELVAVGLSALIQIAPTEERAPLQGALSVISSARQAKLDSVA